MALALHPYTWQNGYAQLAETATWAGGSYHVDEKGERAHYSTPSSKEQLSSTVPNDLGINVLRMWPTLFNGTESPHGLPTWWKASPEVDVLICGGKKNTPCTLCMLISLLFKAAFLVWRSP